MSETNGGGEVEVSEVLAYEAVPVAALAGMAAEMVGRRCYGMEISPAYCDVIVNRWETFSGEKASRQEVTSE